MNTSQNGNEVPFTFYGDLLGVSNAYRLSPDAAYERLDRFYNLCFQHLNGPCNGNRAKVNLFSDSLFFWGDDARTALESLKQLYLNLTSQSLLLRGALVLGKLEFDPRFTVENFQKNLPKGDILPRAVGLASSCKGARLIIDREIAHRLLPGAEWQTVGGYLRSRTRYPTVQEFDIRRFICPVPDGALYELLYFYPTQHGVEPESDSVIRFLQSEGNMTSKDVAIHFTETVNLIKRTRSRITHAGTRFSFDSSLGVKVAISFAIYYANYYVLIIRGHGMRFERDFNNLKQSRKAILVLSFAVLLLATIAFCIYSDSAYRRSFHL